MIPTLEKEATVTSTMEGEEISFGIDENSLVHLQSLLSNLYSDSITAVVRELTTNALDSHIAAGQTAPVSITIPNWTDQNFVVQDFGTGMSVEDIKNVYSLYGASTKRNSNDFNGVLGLGAKAPMAYAQQFTVTSVKNGVKIVALVFKDEVGQPKIKIVSEENTFENNGTTINIPVESMDTARFERAIKHFVKFTVPGTVDCGEEIDYVLEGQKVEEDVYLLPRGNYYDPSYIVMGNVAYEFDFRSHFRVALYADMGDVSFTPSREELLFDKKTQEYVDVFREHIKESYQKNIRKIIDSKDDILEALAVMEDSQTLSREWRGVILPKNIPNSLTYTKWNYGEQGSWGEVQLSSTVNKTYDNYVFVLNSKSLKGNVRKIRAYMKEKGISHLAFLDGDLPDYLDVKTIEWEEIRSKKTVSQSTSDYNVGSDVIPNAVVFADKDQYLRRMNLVRHFGKEPVLLRSNSVKKFFEGNKDALTFQEFIEEEARKISDEEYLFIQDYSYRDSVRELKKFYDLGVKDERFNVEFEEVEDNYKSTILMLSREDRNIDTNIKSVIEEINKDYPLLKILLRNTYRDETQLVVDYINNTKEN